MSATVGWLRRQLPGVVALVLVVTTFLVARLPTPSAAELSSLSSRFRFTPMSVAMPSGFPQKEIRQVNQDYRHIDAWISSVGAGVTLSDLDGDGLANDMCVTDPRIDQVVITPVPGAKSGRYAPFALDPRPLPMNPHIAPMGCLAGDFNEDGRMDVMVYYWGRTPILFLARADASPKLGADSFVPTELVPGDYGAVYNGPQWNTNAVARADFDGDGHEDIFVADYFPDGPVLNPDVSGGVAMNHSMSDAQNGGTDHFFLCAGGTSGDRPAATYTKVDDALPEKVSRGWELAAAANDLDGDGLPEMYLANDFGPDNLLHNRSTPGHLSFTVVTGTRSPDVPKSKTLGDDSFKGMGVDFADLDGNGMYDVFVSNITTSWGIEESNFQWMNTARDKAEERAELDAGTPPFRDDSGKDGTAWSGWGWDVKSGDFDNSGTLSIAQATGFVKGETNRWPQLQELATANDQALDNPFWWPRVNHGDDIAGGQRLKFYVKNTDGRYVDLAPSLGLDVPVPARGIATADVDGDGKLDFAVARQWDQPVFYHNDSDSGGSFLGLELTHEQPDTPGSLPAPGSPAAGAQATVTTPNGRKHMSYVDGGGGHSGKRSAGIHIGLGNVTGPLPVHLQWRDRAGQMHEQDIQLSPGRHSLRLGTTAKEK